MDITTEAVEVDQGGSYAQPLSGLRVSWGSILAGAVTMMAVSLILWALALAIVLTASHATFGSFKGGVMALWICAMVTTLIGGFVGGALAGYLPGNRSRIIAVLHGFLAWCVAFVIASAVEWGTLAQTTRSATNAL